jgi:hypothetical protein
METGFRYSTKDMSFFQTTDCIKIQLTKDVDIKHQSNLSYSPDNDPAYQRLNRNNTSQRTQIYTPPICTSP